VRRRMMINGNKFYSRKPEYASKKSISNRGAFKKKVVGKKEGSEESCCQKKFFTKDERG
jgi:hypothetical protein